MQRLERQSARKRPLVNVYVSSVELQVSFNIINTNDENNRSLILINDRGCKSKSFSMCVFPTRTEEIWPVLPAQLKPAAIDLAVGLVLGQGDGYLSLGRALGCS